MKIEEKILRRGGVQKKRHGHNFEFWALPLNQRWPNMVGSTLIQWQRSKLKIVAVSFFLNTAYFRGRTSFFRLIHLWRPITPVKNVTRPISPTFSESSGRQLSHGPSLDIGFFEQILGNERFMKKIVFLHFFIAAPKKNSSGRQSDNFEDWRLPHSSFRSLCSTFFKTLVEVNDTSKIVGLSPLRSWMIQDRVPQNWCF